MSQNNIIDPNNKYTRMQRKFYEDQSSNMNILNHYNHNDNPDYWNILLEGVKEHSEWVCFDFGCGCGRNIINMLKLGAKKVDGCDISENNLIYSKKNIIKEISDFNRTELYKVNGVGIDGVVPDNKYDFVMSTIVLQHICVYSIRYYILEGKYRILKPNGILSFQMGLNKRDLREGEISYYEDYYEATGTNSKCDVYITNPENVIKDLEKIGFKDITYKISNSFSDHHQYWIYFRAKK